MRNMVFMGLVSVILAVMIGCATVPEQSAEAETPVPTDYSGEPVLIQVKGAGLAPTGNGYFDTIEFQILAGKNYESEKWSIEIVDEKGSTARKVSGTGAVPDLWSWDGLTDRKEKPADGRYRARLKVWFPDAREPIVQETAFFLLDTAGPVSTIRFSEGLFSPDGDGTNDLLEINLNITDELSPVASWTLEIFDSHGSEIKRFSSDEASEVSLTWDGTRSGVLMVDSASDYTAVLTSADRLGNVSRENAEFSTDILVIREGTALRIRVNSITFKAYTADFLDVDPEQRQSNLDTLDLLAAKLKRFPGYKITLEGHAVSVFWDNPAKAEIENRDVLMPLSAARAEAIRIALQERGLDAAAMNIQPMGSSRPIVPFSDLQNRWKNRRVVFILTK